MNLEFWRGGSRRPVSVRRQLGIFCGVAAVALILVSVAAVTASRSLARSQALKDAERTTTRLADLVISPLLPGALTGSGPLRDELDRAIINRLADGYLTQITIWDETGQVRYDNDPAQIGRRLPLPAEARSAITGDVVSSDFTDHPEVNIGPVPGRSEFVEIYVPLRLPHQHSMAFEAYYDYARVNELAHEVLMELIPVVLVPLVLLQLIHIPMAASLASRVRRNEAERVRLLELSLSGSERERLRIAADLHDGPIQELAGTGYAFQMWAASLPQPPEPIVDQLQAAVNRSIGSLRRLMIDLYPPDLDASQLPRTISDLAESLRTKGIGVTFTVAALPELDAETVTALYRIAREALANVVEHACASQVSINLGSRGTEGRQRTPAVYLRIADDGIGLHEGFLDRRAEGHLGLRLLVDRVSHLGGSLSIAPGPTAGVVVTAVLPNGNRSTARPVDARAHKLGVHVPPGQGYRARRGSDHC
ncbi:sensor histidine kinase [Nakamurella sp. PAMC28650]|uniref:sensor histidine kinase n=1 Tax=Nakamurella sp. PAMC28650 TaxID=2762325 RepID=UPI00164CF511|nr:histidine kinase [Nakamurella sp. PAMC28650]QNK79691.1 hypothetical protein H7F38_15620 [Nakamurella sp. PAMC28650]